MSKQSLSCRSIDDLDNVAGSIIELVNGHNVVAFYGAMAAGKTTLIKAICKKLGVIDTMSSPTFSIVNEYLAADNSIIYHFDFYRINSEEEALDLGYENYFYSRNLCLIEWPEKIAGLMSMPHAKIHIEVENQLRLINIEY